MSDRLVKKIFIKGVPYSRYKVRGDINAAEKWSEDVIQQTKGVPKIFGPCEMRALFVLPESSYPSNYKYGPDLDNILKRFQDSLNKTIFSQAPGKDSCVVRLYCEKKKAKKFEEAGVFLEIRSV